MRKSIVALIQAGNVSVISFQISESPPRVHNLWVFVNKEEKLWKNILVQSGELSVRFVQWGESFDICR